MFNKIDKMYCINLLSREDRYQLVQEELSKIGVLDQVYFHRVEKHPQGGAYGCFDSHMWCMRDAVDNGYKNIIIFEDDLKLACDPEQYAINVKCVNELIEQDTFEWINLGYVHALYAQQEYEHCIKGRFSVGTASLWNERFFKEIAHIDPDEGNHTIDDFYCYKVKESYFLKKPFFIQRISKSDHPWDNGQEKYKRIWEDLHINQTINYEHFQMDNHDLQKDKRGKLLHFFHIFIKHYLYEQQKYNTNTITEDVAGLFLKVLEDPTVLDPVEDNARLKQVVQVLASGKIG